MNIFDRIKKDHGTQRELMRRILSTSGDSAERRNSFSAFVREYASHAAAEEQAFYAPMLEVVATTDQSRHSVAEHHEAMELIEELEKTDMSSAHWLATFKKLADENEHHMQEEEADVFEIVKKELSDEDIKKMLATFDARKALELDSIARAS